MKRLDDILSDVSTFSNLLSIFVRTTMYTYTVRLYKETKMSLNNPFNADFISDEYQPYTDNEKVKR